MIADEEAVGRKRWLGSCIQHEGGNLQRYHPQISSAFCCSVYGPRLASSQINTVALIALPWKESQLRLESTSQAYNSLLR